MHKCLFCWRWGRGYVYHSYGGFGTKYACKRHWNTLYHTYRLWGRRVEQQGAEQLRRGETPTPSQGGAMAPWPRPWGYKGALYWAMELTVASHQDFAR